MIETVKDIDLDYLKSFRKRIYYFGLGFIQVILSPSHRLHFYSPELPAITEDIHNHRYDFISKVVKGELTQTCYALSDWGLWFEKPDPPDGTPNVYIAKEESCNPNIKTESPTKLVHLWPYATGSETYQEGESYIVKHYEQHTVKATNCITSLVRGHYKKQAAVVYYPRGKTPVCPFSKEIPEPELWEIIGRML